MSPLTTPLTRRLGMTAPIIAAPISAQAGFVAAVSAAGGLGVLQGTWIAEQDLPGRIAAIRRLTDRPFAVNFVLSLTAAENHRLIDCALGAGATIISTFWGDPAPVIERIHGAGALSFHTVASATEARRVADQGVDVLVAQGVEAGGHVWGEVSTLVLVPAVCDAVPGLPVVAAGGIADGRGLAAVLALGADAAWVGTRFLLAQESGAHPAYRERLKAATETETVYSSVFDGGWPAAPHRCLDNSTLQAWRAAGRPAPGARPGEGEVIARREDGSPLTRYELDEPLAGTTGDVLAMALYAGQGVGLVREEASAAEILRHMADQAAAIMARGGR